MSVTALPSSVAGALEQFGVALDGMAGLDPDRLSWADQEALVRGIDVVARRVEAARLRALEAFSRSGGWDDGTHLSPASWVREELTTARGDAGRDLALGRALRDWPTVAAALADGRVSARAAGVLCSALSRLPDVDDQTVDMLLAAAAVCDPLTLARELAARVAAAAPEQAQDDAGAVFARRRLHHSKAIDDMGGSTPGWSRSWPSCSPTSSTRRWTANRPRTTTVRSAPTRLVRSDRPTTDRRLRRSRPTARLTAAPAVGRSDDAMAAGVSSGRGCPAGASRRR